MSLLTGTQPQNAAYAALYGSGIASYLMPVRGALIACKTRLFRAQRRLHARHANTLNPDSVDADGIGQCAAEASLIWGEPPRFPNAHRWHCNQFVRLPVEIE